jgi:hypothetical protein
MKQHFSGKFLILVICAVLGCVGFANADAVVDWAAIAAQASATATADGRPVPVTGLDLATVHIAIHDAVQGYEGSYQPYCADISNATGSPIAAIAKAAHDVLVNRFPAQAATLDQTYSNYLFNNGLLETDAGVAVGQVAAACIIGLRSNDGSFPPNFPPFLGGTDPGMWRPTPPAFVPGLVPWLATVTPFAIESTDFCHPGPPPNLKSGAYAQEFNEVKSLGSATSTERTADQTDMANFWADNIPQIFSRGLRGIAGSQIDNIGDSARLFALSYIAMADALICSWDSKFTYIFWRPITAIREGDNDGNQNTVGDSTWTPFLTTPPYPDYTSGANSVSGSIMRMLHRFFQTNRMDYSLTSNFPPTLQKTRYYSKFSDAANEVVEVRILHGIHFRTADKVARKQGKKVADYVFENFLRPIH